MKLIEFGGSEQAVMGAEADGVVDFVVEHEAERPAVAAEGETMGCAGRDNEEIAGARHPAASADVLHAFAAEVEDELGVVMRMRGNLGLAVAVELEFAQHKAERVNFDLLDEDGAPSEHEVGFVLVKVGFVLTQGECSAYTVRQSSTPYLLI